MGIEVHVGRDHGEILNVVFVNTLQRILIVWMYTYLLKQHSSTEHKEDIV